jgi:hypothetical protein
VNNPYGVNISRPEPPSSVANKQLIKRPNQSPLSAEFKLNNSNKLLKRSTSETSVVNDVNASIFDELSTSNVATVTKVEKIIHKSKSSRDFGDKENTTINTLLSSKNSDSSQSISNRVRQYIKNNNQIKIYDTIPPHLAPPLV